jgi:hypothetical protein
MVDLSIHGKNSLKNLMEFSMISTPKEEPEKRFPL